MDKLIKRPQDLPDTIDKLQTFILIGKQKLIACKAEIKAIEDVNLGKAVKDQKLNETQDLATILLLAEAKLGELLSIIPNKKASSGRGTRSIPLGITKRQSHYAQQLAANPEIIERIISKALERKELPRRSSVFKEIERRRRREPNILEPIKGQYEVIVIDPPWPYGTIKDPESWRGAASYKELSINQLKEFKLPVAENCVLWLWTTHKFLRDAFDLINIWEFDYKLTFVWDKEKLGIGIWLRCQVEFCLLAIKGKPQWNLTNERDILRISRGKHSEKPNEFYDMVEKLCPTKGEYADIFSRKERLRWKSYGDEI